MGRLIATLIPLPLLIFWLWMFWDMLENDTVPQCFVTFTNGRNVKLTWAVEFVFFNIFTAIFYYLTEHRIRH
jgi:hypothetical protein